MKLVLKDPKQNAPKQTNPQQQYNQIIVYVNYTNSSKQPILIPHKYHKCLLRIHHNRINFQHTNMTRNSTRKPIEPQPEDTGRKLRDRRPMHFIDLSTSSDSDSDTENTTTKPQPRTPRKQKAKATDENEVSPAKLKKKVNSPQTPSNLIRKLEINSPEKKCVSKQLFENGGENGFMCARKALHGTLPKSLPAREEELERLRKFVGKHLEEKTGGSLYISGPPGTGKTACLSMILQEENIADEFLGVYINCTAIKSSGAVYGRVVKELNVTCKGKSEKEYISVIEKFLVKTKKSVLLVLDEIDQLDTKKQSVLYTIFEWPSLPDSKLILIGIANSLDLTDRILPRLHSRCLNPELMHFASYSKHQIVQILSKRLEEAGAVDVFTQPALHMLAAKVSSVSGDVRRALDIARRVVDLSQTALKPIQNASQHVDLKEVVTVLDSVYGTSQKLNEEDGDESFPLQQKLLVCSLLLMLKKSKNKDVTLGRLHEVYRKVCTKRNLMAVDQAEFAGMCSLVEARGVVKVVRKGEPRMHKIRLEWDEEEVAAALGDKQLMAQVLQDDACLGGR